MVVPSLLQKCDCLWVFRKCHVWQNEERSSLQLEHLHGNFMLSLHGADRCWLHVVWRNFKIRSDLIYVTSAYWSRRQRCTRGGWVRREKLWGKGPQTTLSLSSASNWRSFLHQKCEVQCVHWWWLCTYLLCVTNPAWHRSIWAFLLKVSRLSLRTDAVCCWYMLRLASGRGWPETQEKRNLI